MNAFNYSLRSTQLSFVSKKSAFSSFPNQWWKQKVNMSQKSMDKKGLLNYPYKKVKLFIFSFDNCYDLFLILWYLWYEYISYLLFIYSIFPMEIPYFLREHYYSNFFLLFLLGGWALSSIRSAKEKDIALKQGMFYNSLIVVAFPFFLINTLTEISFFF